MGGGCDREPFARRVEPDRLTNAPDRREARGEALHRGRVEPEVTQAPLVQSSGDGARDDIARREVSHWVLVGHEGSAIFVAEDGTLAA